MESEKWKKKRPRPRCGRAPGTRLVIDYLLDEASSNAARLRLRERMPAFVRARGEPMRSAYSLRAMQALFAENGFRAVGNFAIEDLAPSYERTFGRLPFAISGYSPSAYSRSSPGTA